MITDEPDGATFWERHYRGRPGPSGGRPSAALIRFASGRTPGRALDLGCAKGDDAVWLARQGWSALGVDVAAAALEEARRNAERAGVADHARFEHHDLMRTLPEGPFDLVSAMFFHSPAALDRASILHRAAARIAPGGLLLSVTHASAAPWSWADPDTAWPTPQEELDAIGLPQADWRRVEVAAVERQATGPAGQTATVTDNVLALEHVVVKRRGWKRTGRSRAGATAKKG